jgi:hypothetical protein
VEVGRQLQAAAAVGAVLLTVPDNVCYAGAM